MLAKNADDRYQSVFGIQSDLLKCMDLLGRGLAADFVVGGEDMRSRFRISQRLYGREEEIDRLSKIFDGITRGKVRHHYLIITVCMMMITNMMMMSMMIILMIVIVMRI